MDRAVDWFPQKLQSNIQVKVRFRHGKKLNNQFFYLEETISVFSSANNNKRKRSSQDVTPRPMMITYHKNFQSSKYGKKSKSDVNQEISAETIKLSKMENLILAWITCHHPAEFYKQTKLYLYSFCNFPWKNNPLYIYEFLHKQTFLYCRKFKSFSVVFITVTNVSVRLCDAVKSGRKCKWNTQNMVFKRYVILSAC